MKERRRKYQDQSAVDFLLLREELGLRRYRKTKKRDEEEKGILIDLGLKKIKEKEEKDFILIKYFHEQEAAARAKGNTPFKGFERKEGNRV
jgi:hypothetical protein